MGHGLGECGTGLAQRCRGSTRRSSGVTLLLQIGPFITCARPGRPGAGGGRPWGRGSPGWVDRPRAGLDAVSLEILFEIVPVEDDPAPDAVVGQPALSDQGADHIDGHAQDGRGLSHREAARLPARRDHRRHPPLCRMLLLALKQIPRYTVSRLSVYPLRCGEAHAREHQDTPRRAGSVGRGLVDGLRAGVAPTRLSDLDPPRVVGRRSGGPPSAPRADRAAHTSCALGVGATRGPRGRFRLWTPSRRGRVPRLARP